MPEARKSVRLADVAGRAGVSVSLVSRILNNDPTLTTRDETRRAVLSAVRDLGYTPHFPAQSLRSSRAGALGLVVYDVTSPIYQEVLRGAQAAVKDTGFVLLLGSADSPRSDHGDLRDAVVAGRIDGCLLHGGYGTEDPALQELYQLIPTVVINTSAQAGVPSVRLDDERATATAVQHLAELGHLDITFITGAPGPTSDARLAGFRAGLRAADLPITKASVCSGGWTADTGYESARKLAARRARPTAVVVANVIAALGVLSGLRATGIRVPQDMSVVAVHEAWFASHLDPPLTTVDLPLYELGRTGMSTLITSLDAPVPDDTLIQEPPPRLIHRESTTPPG